MSDPTVGIVDTNIFIHAQTNDPLTEECARFLAGLEQGTVTAHLEPLALHELSYVLPQVIKQMKKVDVASYLLMILGWPGIRGETVLLRETVERWARTPRLSFVDAYLAALAARRSCPVYSKNIRDLVAQGIAVPDPIPSGRPG